MYRLTHVCQESIEEITTCDSAIKLMYLIDTLDRETVLVTQDLTLSRVWFDQRVSHYFISNFNDVIDFNNVYKT